MKSGVKREYALGEQLNASGWAGISGALSILLITLWVFLVNETDTVLNVSVFVCVTGR